MNDDLFKFTLLRTTEAYIPHIPDVSFECGSIINPIS